MEKIIREYLEKECKTDKALALAYDEKKMKGCMDFIMKQAKKELNGISGGIWHDTVYAWARHYMIDGDTEPAETETKADAEPVKAFEEVKAESKAARADKPCDGQMDLFAGMAV